MTDAPLHLRNRVKLRLHPCSVRAALDYVKTHHRHLPRLNGGLFAVAVQDDEGKIRGVGIWGHPARVWNGTGRGVILRCATDGAPNACSMIYGALCRAAKALGWTEAWTYTLPEEPGCSLRAAGFECVGTSDGGEWDRPSRRRGSAVKPEPKTRWRKIL